MKIIKSSLLKEFYEAKDNFFFLIEKNDLYSNNHS